MSNASQRKNKHSVSINDQIMDCLDEIVAGDPADYIAEGDVWFDIELWVDELIVTVDFEKMEEVTGFER